MSAPAYRIDLKYVGLEPPEIWCAEISRVVDGRYVVSVWGETPYQAVEAARVRITGFKHSDTKQPVYMDSDGNITSPPQGARKAS